MTSWLTFVEHLFCIKHGMALGPMKNTKSIKHASAPKRRIVNLAADETSIWKDAKYSNSTVGKLTNYLKQVMEINKTCE